MIMTFEQIMIINDKIDYLSEELKHLQKRQNRNIKKENNIKTQIHLLRLQLHTTYGKGC